MCMSPRCSIHTCQPQKQCRQIGWVYPCSGRLACKDDFHEGNMMSGEFDCKLSKLNCMQVIWQRLYSRKSGMEKGTLLQLKNFLNRSAVPSDPKKSMKSVEDFLELVLVAHILVAGEEELKSKQYDSVHNLAKAIVDSFVDLGEGNMRSGSDKIRLYATEVITLGLLWHNFCDAIKEGDSERVIRHWKFLMIAFKATNHCNYAKEAFTLLMHRVPKFRERKITDYVGPIC